MEQIIHSAATWLWGPPMLVFLSVIGVYFTLRLRGLQFTHIFRAGKLTYTKRVGKGEGNITPLQSFFSALGGLIGNGNLAGAATAVFMGGPGALLWMWVGAFAGMIIVYVETLLGLMHREKSSDGTYSGGPMYYIQKVLRLKWLAVTYSLVTGIKVLFATSTIQSNSISLAASAVFPLSFLPAWIPTQLPFCIILAFLTWLVIIGGLYSIARTLEKVTPLMVIVYTFAGTLLILAHIDRIFEVIELIFRSAFTTASATGGFAGAGVMMAIRYGVARGFYSNEAGSGSSPIMYSTAKTENVYHQSLIAMFGVLIDTVVSTFTILAILVTGVWTSGLTSTALTSSAFQSLYRDSGGYIVVFSSFLFGYSTLIVWCFYAEQCFAYIWGPGIKKFFRWAFSIAIVFGFLKVESVWSVGDLFNAVSMVVNITALIFLVKYAVKESKRRLLDRA